VGRRYQIDIVASHVLEFQHHAGQFPVAYLAAFTQVTDFEVLAKITEQAAIGEEDGTGSVAADKFGFFAEMGMKTTDNRLTAGFTVAEFIREAVDTAFTGADRTGFQFVDQCFHLNWFFVPLKGGPKLYDLGMPVK